MPLAGGSPENRIAGAKGGASAVSFVLDGEDVLHVIWQGTGPDAIWYSRCDVSGAGASGKIRDADNWAPAQRVDDSAKDPRMGDLAVDEAGRLWIAYSQASPIADGHSRVQDGGVVYIRHNGRKESDEIWMATPSDRGWTRRVLTLPGAFRAPVMDLDPSGTLHMAFSRDDSWLLYYLQIPDLARSFASGLDLTRILPHGPWSGTGFVNYSVVGWGERALVVFEKSEHIILYCYFDGRDWTRKPLHYGRDKFHRPQLARDEHGVAWVFWSNSTRGHTFYSRWLGTRFSDPYESRTLAGDPLLHKEATNIPINELSAGPAPSDFHTVQKQPSPGSGSLGMTLAATAATGGGHLFRPDGGSGPEGGIGPQSALPGHVGGERHRRTGRDPPPHEEAPGQSGTENRSAGQLRRPPRPRLRRSPLRRGALPDVVFGPLAGIRGQPAVSPLRGLRREQGRRGMGQAQSEPGGIQGGPGPTTSWTWEGKATAPTCPW